MIVLILFLSWPKKKPDETRFDRLNDTSVLDELFVLWYMMQAVNDSTETNMQVVNCNVVCLLLSKTGYIAVSFVN